MSSPSSFPSFPLLPLELRLRIWSFALPPPQLVSLVAYTEDERAPEPIYDSSPTSDRHGFPHRWSKTYLERCSTLTLSKPTPLLHINNESRSLVLSRYHILIQNDSMDLHFEDWVLISGSWCKATSQNHEGQMKALEPRKLEPLNKRLLISESRPFTLFNLHLDILFLADPLRRDRYSSLDVVIRSLDSDLRSSLRMLALSYYTWRKDRTFGLLQLLSEFKCLEKVWVCFVGSCGEEDRRGRGGRGETGGWLDAVRREGDDLDERLRQVEKEVAEDVRELERKSTGWKSPVVSVVRDRKALVGVWNG